MERPVRQRKPVDYSGNGAASTPGWLKLSSRTGRADEEQPAPAVLPISSEAGEGGGKRPKQHGARAKSAPHDEAPHAISGNKALQEGSRARKSAGDAKQEQHAPTAAAAAPPSKEDKGKKEKKRKQREQAEQPRKEEAAAPAPAKEEAAPKEEPKQKKARKSAPEDKQPPQDKGKKPSKSDPPAPAMLTEKSSGEQQPAGRKSSSAKSASAPRASQAEPTPASAAATAPASAPAAGPSQAAAKGKEGKGKEGSGKEVVPAVKAPPPAAKTTTSSGKAAAKADSAAAPAAAPSSSAGAAATAAAAAAPAPEAAAVAAPARASRRKQPAEAAPAPTKAAPQQDAAAPAAAKPAPAAGPSSRPGGSRPSAGALQSLSDPQGLKLLLDPASELLRRGAAEANPRAFTLLQDQYQQLQGMYIELKDQQIQGLEQLLDEQDDYADTLRASLEKQVDHWRAEAEKQAALGRESGSTEFAAKAQAMQEENACLRVDKASLEEQVLALRKELVERDARAAAAHAHVSEVRRQAAAQLQDAHARLAAAEAARDELAERLQALQGPEGGFGSGAAADRGSGSVRATPAPPTGKRVAGQQFPTPAAPAMPSPGIGTQFPTPPLPAVPSPGVGVQFPTPPLPPVVVPSPGVGMQFPSPPMEVEADVAARQQQEMQAAGVVQAGGVSPIASLVTGRRSRAAASRAGSLGLGLPPASSRRRQSLAEHAAKTPALGSAKRSDRMLGAEATGPEAAGVREKAAGAVTAGAQGDVQMAEQQKQVKAAGGAGQQEAAEEQQGSLGSPVEGLCQEGAAGAEDEARALAPEGLLPPSQEPRRSGVSAADGGAERPAFAPAAPAFDFDFAPASAAKAARASAAMLPLPGAGAIAPAAQQQPKEASGSVESRLMAAPPARALDRLMSAVKEGAREGNEQQQHEALPQLSAGMAQFVASANAAAGRLSQHTASRSAPARAPFAAAGTVAAAGREAAAGSVDERQDSAQQDASHQLSCNQQPPAVVSRPAVAAAAAAPLTTRKAPAPAVAQAAAPGVAATTPAPRQLQFSGSMTDDNHALVHEAGVGGGAAAGANQKLEGSKTLSTPGMTPKTARLVGGVVNFFGFKVVPLQEEGSYEYTHPQSGLRFHMVPTQLEDSELAADELGGGGGEDDAAGGHEDGASSVTVLLYKPVQLGRAKLPRHLQDEIMVPLFSKHAFVNQLWTAVNSSSGAALGRPTHVVM